MPSDEEAADIVRRATPGLLALPGVMLVGLGGKEVGGELTGELVIKVYVREKKPAGELSRDEVIPARIEGVATDVVSTGGDIVPLAAPPGACEPAPTDGGDGTAYRPLVGGARIFPSGHPNFGTLGCLVRRPSIPGMAYALTCEHVITSIDRSTGIGLYEPEVGVTKVGQPDGDTGSSGCCDDTIGTYAVGIRIPTMMDEALIRLDAGMSYAADILEIGPQGKPGPVRGEHTIVQSEVRPGPYPVRKRGARTGLTGGVVGALAASGGRADNLIIVNPNPPTSACASGTVYFAYEGDSGSVLINNDAEVVGLIFARDGAGHGLAYPIRRVLERLADDGLLVEIATATTAGTVITVPGAATTAVPDEVVTALGGAPAESGGALRAPVTGLLDAFGPRPPAVRARLRQDLDSSTTGRLLTTLWHRHRDELTDLVARDRRVKLAWHRRGGAALFQLMIRMPERPDVALPRTVHGEPLARCVQRLYQVVTRAASARLRGDLERAYAALPELAGLTYPQILAALDHGAKGS
jgi:hypothetical protein